MQIIINGKTHDFKKEVKLFDALQSLQLHEQKGIAVAINDEVIAKQNWTTQTLNDRDNIIIITATQGG